MRVLKINCKTKKEVYDNNDSQPQPPSPPPAEKGIDNKKLKAILKAKGIITNNSEVE